MLLGGFDVSLSRVHASINEVINFQGKLVNSDGTNITDGSYYFKVDIYNAAVGGASQAAAEYKYSSTISSVTNTSVVYSSDTDEATLKAGMVIWNTTDDDYAIINSVNTTTNTLTVDRDVDTAPHAWAATDAITTRIQLNDGIFNIKVVNISSLDFDTDSYYLNVQFDSTPSGGDALNETFSPRKRLDAVPFAMRSRYSDELGGIGSGQFLRSDTSDNYTSGTLAFDVGTTLDINGDLSIDDTAIAFDGASTDFTMTGDLTINTSHLIVEKSTGDVGIGDATPDHKLDVAGNIGMTAGGYLNWGDTDGDSGYGIKDNSGTLQYKNSGGSWANFGSGSSLWTPSGSDIYYNSGNVAIGSSGPFNERLNVNGRIYISDSTAPGTTTNRLYSVSGKLYWNGIELGESGSIYSENGSIADGSYVEVVHNQGTNSILATGWVYDDITSKWIGVESTDSTNIYTSQEDWDSGVVIGSPKSPISDGTVKDEQKISDLVGGLVEDLGASDQFGIAVSNLGDLDGDGVEDIVVGAFGDDDGDAGAGAVYILFLNADGTVKDEQKISDLVGGLVENLGAGDQFGISVSSLGDLDGDGIEDIVVGARCDDDGGTDAGAVYILFLNADGTVKDEQKISDLYGGLAENLGASDYFGISVSGIGDLDGDGIEDIVVGAHGDDDGGAQAGAVYILFLNSNGMVKSEQKISDTYGGLLVNLADNDFFGWAVSNIGDLDGDGVEDIVVGARGDDDGGTNAGAVYILFLNKNGTVKDEPKISDTYGSLEENLGASDYFGMSVSNIGDLDGDGVEDIVVGADRDDDGGADAGAVYILLLRSDGTVKDEQKISDLYGGLLEDLETLDYFGRAVSSLGDLDGDGVKDIVVGANGDDDDDSAAGAVYILSLKGYSTRVGIKQKYLQLDSAFSNGVYTSSVIPTLGSKSYGDIKWEEDLDTYGDISVQTRSGSTSDSTDGTWEAWKPFTVTTNYLDLENSDTHTNWTGTNATVSEGDIARDVDYFEDEDESTVGNTTKVVSSTDGGYIEATISSTDISGYDYVTLWVRASQKGNLLKIGVGESAATEQEEEITIDTVSTWQKIYWDISDITSADINGVTKIRLTNYTSDSNLIYIDNVRAEKVLYNNERSDITSTPDDYLQYRVIFTTTDLSYQPKLENISFTFNNGYKIEVYDTNTVRLYNYSGSTKSLRLNVSTIGSAAGGDSLPSGIQGQLMYYNTGLWVATSTVFINGTDVGIGDTTPDHKLDIEGNVGLTSSGYINFGDTDGTSGYGFRYNSGILEYKDSGGSWFEIAIESDWADPKKVLEAMYSGAVLSGDGSDNDGSMDADNAGSSNEWMNYYEFYSVETDLNDYDVRVTFTLPEDFDSWDTNAVIFDYVTQSTDSANNKVDYTVYLESSGTLDATDTANVSSVAGTWTTTTIAGSSLTDCNAAGETCLLIIRMYSKDSYYVRVGDITFDYVRP